MPSLEFEKAVENTYKAFYKVFDSISGPVDLHTVTLIDEYHTLLDERKMDELQRTLKRTRKETSLDLSEMVEQATKGSNLQHYENELTLAYQNMFGLQEGINSYQWANFEQHEKFSNEVEQLQQLLEGANYKDLGKQLKRFDSILPDEMATERFYVDALISSANSLKHSEAANPVLY